VQSQPDEPSAIDNFFIFFPWQLPGFLLMATGPIKGPSKQGICLKKFPLYLLYSISPADPFIGPVEIRGKKNKKKIFLFYFFSPGFLLML